MIMNSILSINRHQILLFPESLDSAFSIGYEVRYICDHIKK